MSIRMMSGMMARIVTVLRDYLPAELDLIDAEEADGITTPDIATDDYYEYDPPNITKNYPACTLQVVSSTITEGWPDGFGRHLHAIHRINVKFHVTPQETDGDAVLAQDLIFRYVTGAARVLSIMYEGLQTSADPTRKVSLVECPEPITYVDEVDQEGGVVCRTGTLPIAILQIETR